MNLWVVFIGPRESRKPTLLAMDNFFFRGGIELNHQIYFFHCLTSPISVNRLLGEKLIVII